MHKKNFHVNLPQSEIGNFSFIFQKDILRPPKNKEYNLIFPSTVFWFLTFLTSDEVIYDDISGVYGTYNKVNKCLAEMKKLNIDFTVLFIVNKFNDVELEKVGDFTERVTNKIIIDYILQK